MGFPQAEKPVPADLRDAFSGSNQSHHQGLLRGKKLWWQGSPRYDRYICGPDTALCEIDGCRCLRSSAYPDDHHLGLFKILGVLAIVMGHGEIQRIDPLEIIRVQSMLTGNLRG